VITRQRNGQQERQTLSLSPAKGIWRELAALAVLDRAGKEAVGGPLALCCIDPDRPCDIWVGGLTADKAKLVDTAESVFHLPAEMLGSAGQRLYQEGVRHAERMALRLNRAVAAYHRELEDELEGQFWKRGAKVKQKASTHYWTAAEQHVPELLAVVAKPELLCPPGGGAGPAWSQTAWGRALASAARSAYELACPRQTARQMKAYALGLKELFREPPDTDTEVDTDTEGHEA